jgi:signal transduction histidine kinase
MVRRLFYSRIILAGRRLTMEISTLGIDLATQHSAAIITIADNGAGIPESMRETLFESFRSNKSDGNGLGLWIVNKIIRSHGGKIQYRSSSARGRSGTVFRIALPTRNAA